MAGLKLPFTGQLARFGAVGLANTALSYGFYVLGLALGLPYWAASLVALIFGIITGFFAQGKLVFCASTQRRFPYFVAVWAVLYCVNVCLILVFSWLGFDYYTAGLIALIPTVLMSFLLNRAVVFRP
ncbi:GtrA family protein [Loktanella sp. DJP18]|uniref:GtrA family protein n=1 Tax=Loktanella sp. DJP18 TaxID=3409788 RepID=UPI003BB816BC